MADNVLYYGDNLDVLRLHGKEKTVDLIYTGSTVQQRSGVQHSLRSKGRLGGASANQGF
jgi:hypothetical protein